MGKFWFAKQGAHAIATKTEAGFLVQAGSTAIVNGSPTVKRDRPLRDKLVKDGVLVAHTDPAYFRFARDFEFESPSAAAGVIKDGNSSGTNDWRHVKTGKKMSEMDAN